MQEKVFYNALNVLLRSDYQKLRKLKERHATWRASWENCLAEGGNAPNPEEEWGRLEKIGIRLFLDEDPEYPSLLKEIPWAPFGIYSLGSFSEPTASFIAIVGTRKATPVGKDVAREFSKELAQAGCVVVSGLALGIDAAAHEGCLAAGGKTIAVLANGLDYFYPRSNENLAKKIIEKNGALVSEYPLGSPTLPYRFLERNRIVSGLSRGVLVVEAPKQSGALVTARFATEQNREVFVIPGPITHPNFFGSNQLIRSGAQLVTDPKEILDTLGIDSPIKDGAADDNATPEEKIVIGVLRKSLKPVSVDKIIEDTNLKAQTVNQILGFLLMRNAVKEDGEGYILL